MTHEHEQQLAPVEAQTPYPMETITRQYGKWRVTAIQPATQEGKNALVGQALPQIAELLRAYDRRMAEEARQRDALMRDAVKREAEQESVA